MKELGITKGVVQDKNYILTSDGQLVVIVNYPAVAQPNDTKFIAEAFKVANETNMMPREMAEINRKLLEACKKARKHLGELKFNSSEEERLRLLLNEVILKADPK